MAYVYRHIRLDNNQPFYIGIGSDCEYKRANSMKDRNKHWKNIVSSVNYRVEILIDDISWDDACEREKEFILLYGRRDLKSGTLVNLTDGGEGSLNRKMSESTKQILLNANKGKNLSFEHRLNISKSSTKKRSVIDLSNGFIYKSVKEASDRCNIGYSNLKNMLLGNRTNNTTLVYSN